MRLAMWALCGAAFLSVSFGSAMAAQGTRAQDPDVLSALLTEVRGLRQAMEQMASAGPRVQLALGRLQLQEQRVNTMLRRLETVREQLGAAERALAEHQTQMAGIERGLKDPELQARPEREEIVRQMTHELKELQGRGVFATSEVQRFQTEVATLEQQIATEQGRWSEINRALEDLERALGKTGGR